jgi:hypothetical protein
MLNLNPSALVALLSTVNKGHVSIEQGMLTFEDGTEVNLLKALEQQPRVLITVSGGVADYNSDDGVEVVKFDWDDFNDQDVPEGGIPAHFADLGAGMALPIDGQPGVTS